MLSVVELVPSHCTETWYHKSSTSDCTNINRSPSCCLQIAGSNSLVKLEMHGWDVTFYVNVKHVRCAFYEQNKKKVDTAYSLSSKNMVICHTSMKVAKVKIRWWSDIWSGDYCSDNICSWRSICSATIIVQTKFTPTTIARGEIYSDDKCSSDNCSSGNFARAFVVGVNNFQGNSHGANCHRAIVGTLGAIIRQSIMSYRYIYMCVHCICRGWCSDSNRYWWHVWKVSCDRDQPS